MSLKSKLIEICPDAIFAKLYTAYNKRGIKIQRSFIPTYESWLITGDEFALVSPTARFTSVSMKEFEAKFEPYFKIEKGDVCLDVGACIGDTTFPIALKTGSSGHVYAVEPNKLNIEYLEINTKFFPYVETYELAVWKEKGSVTFHEHSTPTGHSLIPLSLRKTETIVQTDTLDNLFKDVVFDFAKIDVQSAEVEVLSGATEFLKTTRKLVVECHHDYKNELKDTHKTVFRILNRHYSNVMYSEKYNLCYAWR